MKLMLYIKKINLIKKIDNIGSNKFNFESLNSDYNNAIIRKNFINNKIVKLTLHKNNNIIFMYNNIFKLNYFNPIFLKFIQSHSKMDLDTLNFFKNMSNNKYYSSYNFTFLYNLTFNELNKKNELLSKKNTNKVLNIRSQFKTSNQRILRKTSTIDLILKKYLESYMEDKISINFDKYNINFFRKKTLYVKVLRRKLRRMRRMLKWAKISLRNFIRITLVFLCTKDIEIFSKVLVKIMDSMHYKNHRRFLYYLKLFISKSMHYFFNILKFEGFFFYLSGKISGGGNSKKKNYAIRCGKYSLTNKMLKLKFKKGLIHTKTGVLGYKLMISYR